ncbi:TPA: amidohydrolase [Clostridioides difficile]|nr:amidohydrolase [Clostridioides difficile]
MSDMFMNLAKQFENDIISWRRYFHKNPEIGMELPNTVNFIQEKLEEFNIEYKVGCNGSSIAGLIGNKNNGKCILIRSDMDALPVIEQTELEFKSNNNCMHACGHDAHTAMLLGAAKILKTKENELKGSVKLMFQPGEEVFAGAKAMISEGILENPKVDSAFSMHVVPTMTNKSVVYGKELMSSCYGFKITIRGKGGHGSQPENCIDPINTGVHIYLALQELISRECPPQELATLTLGQFKSGEVCNVIPNDAVLQGTLRTFSPTTRDLLIKRISEVVQSVSTTYRCSADIEVLSNVPALICNDELNRKFISYIYELDQNIRISEFNHTMGSEDFAYISEKVPTCFMYLGAGIEDTSKWYVAHNPKVMFNDNCLALGSAIYAQCAYQWLKNMNKEGL